MVLTTGAMVAKETAKIAVKEAVKKTVQETSKEALKNKLQDSIKQKVKSEVTERIKEELDDNFVDTKGMEFLPKGMEQSPIDSKKEVMNHSVGQELKNEESLKDKLNKTIESVPDSMSIKIEESLNNSIEINSNGRSENGLDKQDGMNLLSNEGGEFGAEKPDNIDKNPDGSFEEPLKEKSNETMARTPENNGQWGGEREDSKWIPDKEDISREKSTNPDEPYGNLDYNDIEASEYDEFGFRSLTEEEKQELRENTNWPDKVEGIEGCKINNEGVIRYPCRNKDLAGKENPITGVKYEKRIVEIEGYKVEVVMPEFESVFDAQLPDELCLSKDKEQFKECNKQLYEAIQNDPELAKKFTPEQLEQIKDGMKNGGAPDGYTWHHDAEKGKMQLTDSDTHGDSRHTGGRMLWGGGNDNR